MINSSDSKNHWEEVYRNKSPEQVSWTQAKPQTALEAIRSFGLLKTAKIIDIGGGDSNLVDFLLEEGFENITVLDISSKAIEKAQNRLGAKAKNVNWVISDVIEFEPTTTYDFWHDRAAFHFLTTTDQISEYVDIARKSVTGHLFIGTFSENGPTKCSGLEIKQYSEKALSETFSNGFEKISCKTENHTTPFDTIQNFIFCSFKRNDRQIEM
jgi:hypothetical protein